MRYLRSVSGLRQFLNCLGENVRKVFNCDLNTNILILGFEFLKEFDTLINQIKMMTYRWEIRLNRLQNKNQKWKKKKGKKDQKLTQKMKQVLVSQLFWVDYDIDTLKEGSFILS